MAIEMPGIHGAATAHAILALEMADALVPTASMTDECLSGGGRRVPTGMTARRAKPIASEASASGAVTVHCMVAEKMSSEAPRALPYKRQCMVPGISVAKLSVSLFGDHGGLISRSKRSYPAHSPRCPELQLTRSLAVGNMASKRKVWGEGVEF